MLKQFLALGSQDRLDVYTTHAVRTGRSAQVLEKDVWVCWVLDALFTMPEAMPMAFKGGTSLSKIYDVINRFSEDVDVTIDYRYLDNSVDPFADSMGRKQQDELTKRLRARVAEHIALVVAPYMRERLATEFGLDPDAVRIDSENVWVAYPSALKERDEYVNDAVKLEFGGRNAIDPNERHRVTPYLAAAFPHLAFPAAEVTVLAPERTFWEKATLIHAELSRREFHFGVERLSRHWYDLDRLAEGEIGRRALANHLLLEDVVKVKKVFYRSAQADYDLCATGGLRLVSTDGDVVAHLQRDYDAMARAGMFYGDAPSFSEILDRLEDLVRRINVAAP
jgi:hypothetical protein